VAGVTERISEKAVLLGQQKAMVGILTQPVVAELRGDRPAILILNTGIIHRVGHNRMYVNLSRALAQAGYVVLRFDLSGIGDSESRGDGLKPLDTALADIRDAIDVLERARQSEEVIICGLCSGADHAVLYGYTDPRVVGLVLMDPSIPPTARYYFAYIWRRLMRLSSWTRVALGRSVFGRRLLERLAVALKLRPRAPSLDDREVRSYLERVYQDSIALGIQFLAVFTAVEDTRQNYREQLFDAFPSVSFGAQLRLEFFEEANHTFMFESERVRLTQVIFDWLSRTNFTIRRGQRLPFAVQTPAPDRAGLEWRSVLAFGVFDNATRLLFRVWENVL
jgi:pimeloyl-ACP methyl ester carboxylesterase